jgi:hypothetical protein
VTVDEVLHPFLKFGSDQVLNIKLIKLFLKDTVLESYLNLRESDFDKISLNW